MQEKLNELLRGYSGDAHKYFADLGGHRSFLENFGQILEDYGKGLLDILGDFEGSRYPRETDVGTYEKTYSWFFHHHDHEKNERGHFHLFASPSVFDDNTATEKTHIIAIELTTNGDFYGFFVPNRWVTKDHLRPVRYILSILRNFHTNNSDHPDCINIWLSAMLLEFEDVVQELLEQRDLYLSKLSLVDRNEYFENEEIERICERAIQ